MDQSRHPGKINATKYLERLKDAQDFAQAAMASIQQRNELTQIDLDGSQSDLR